MLWLCAQMMVAGPAWAGDKATAEAAFQQGKDLLKAGDFQAACTAFEKSQALDPQLGTEYNLATCYEKAGRLASSWGAFRELAQRDTNAARRADSERHAAALQPRLIKLLVSVRAPVLGLKVTRNGEDVSQSVGIESPIDPGDYDIGAIADGYKPWSVKVSARQEGGTLQVTVPELEKLPAAARPVDGHGMKPLPAAPWSPGHEPAAASGGHRSLGLYIGAGGLAVTTGGLVFGALALGQHNAARKACMDGPLDPCVGDVATAARDERSARTFGNVSTAMVGVGAAALITGIVLYVTAPSGRSAEHAALQLAPAVIPDGFAVTAAGRF